MSKNGKKRKVNPTKGKVAEGLYCDGQTFATKNSLISYLKNEVYKLRQEIDGLTNAKADEVPSDQADAH